MARQNNSSNINSPLPALCALACVALGVWLGGIAPPTPVWLPASLAGACAALSLLVPHRAQLTILGVGAVLVGAASYQARVVLLPADALGPALRAHEGTLLRVEGVVVSAPERRERAGRFAPYTFTANATVFRLQLERIVGMDGAIAPASGLMSVRVQGGAPNVSAGQRIRVTGRALPTLGASNPSPTSMLRWASQTNWAGALLTSDARNISIVEDRRLSLAAFRATIQRRAGQWLAETEMPDDARAVLAGALFGAEEPELADVRRTLERVGAAHVLAISGLHLAALSWLLLIALRPFPMADRWAPLLVGLVILLYAWIVPARPAVVRATIMVLVFLLAEASGRRYHRLAVLALAGVVVLLWRPLDLTRPGFQLTFAVVGALIAMAEPLRIRLFGDPLIDPDLDRLRDRLVLSAQRVTAGALAAWLVATPLLAYHFGIFNPLAPIGALVLAPVFSVTLALGQAAALTSALWPTLAQPIAPIVGSLAAVTVELASMLSRAPGAFVRLPQLHPAMVIAFLLTLCWWVFLRRRPRLRVVATAALFLWIAGALLHSARANGVGSGVSLRIDTFDVGDGTCHLVRTRDGAVLWDAGGTDLDAGMRELPQAIRQLGAWRVPTVVITHANIDHYAYLPDLLEPLGVQRVYLTPFMLEDMQAADDGPLLALRESLQGIEILPLRAGDDISLGSATMRIVWPEPSIEPVNVNNTSIVAHIVTHGEAPRSALLTGDVEDEAIVAIRTTQPELAAEVMEVPHHGSARIEAMDWVFAIDPQIVLQSTGPGRADDERWDDARAGRRWLTTATMGSYSVEILHDGRIVTYSTSERLQPIE